MQEIVLDTSGGSIAGWVADSIGRYRVLGYSTRTLDVVRELDLAPTRQRILTAPGGERVLVPYGENGIDRKYPVVLAGWREGWAARAALNVDSLRDLLANKLPPLSHEHHEVTYLQPEGRLRIGFNFDVGPDVPREHLLRVVRAFAREWMTFRGRLEPHPFWAALSLHPQADSPYLLRIEDGVAVERFTRGELSLEEWLRDVAPQNVQVLAEDCMLARDPDHWRIYWRDGARTALPRAEALRVSKGGDRDLARMLADCFPMRDDPDEGVVAIAARLWHQGLRELARQLIEFRAMGRPEDVARLACAIRKLESEDTEG